MDFYFYDKLIAMTSPEQEKLFSTNLSITHEEKVEKKMKRVNEVRKMKQAHLSNREISRRTGLHQKTVARYLDKNFNPVHAVYGQKKTGLLIPYMQEIDSMLEVGTMGTAITEKIAEKGYGGSPSNIRYYIADWKKRRKHFFDSSNETHGKMEIIERNNVFKLLYHPLEKVECISLNVFEKLCSTYPCFQQIHAIVWEFRNLLAAKIPDGFASWLKIAKSLKIRELNSFVEGIKRDFKAVFNAVKFDYSNGLAEGKVKAKTHQAHHVRTLSFFYSQKQSSINRKSIAFQPSLRRVISILP